MKTTTIRIPDDLHKQIRQAALDSDTSMNAWILRALETKAREGKTMKNLTGYDAIEYAEEKDLLLCKYTDPIEEYRDDVTPSEAREIAGEDPGLIFIEIEQQSSTKKPRFRIENVQKATLNGRKVKLFKAFEYDPNAQAYIFCGQFDAPQNTPNDQLVSHIPPGE